MGGETSKKRRAPERGGWLRIAAAARLLGVSANTLRRADGYRGVPCYRSPGGHRRYLRSDIEAFLAARSGSPETNARAGSRDDEALKSLIELGAVVAGNAEPAEMAHAVADRVRRSTGAALCGIYRVTGGVVQGLALCGEDGPWEPAESWSGPLTQLPAAAEALKRSDLLVVRAGDPLLGEAERARLVRNGFVSEVLLALKVEGRSVGLLDLFSRKRTDWSESTQFLRAAGQLVAGALDKALLLDDLEQRNTTLRSLVEIGDLAGGSHDAVALAHDLTRRLVQSLGVSVCTIHAIEGDSVRPLAGYGAPGWTDEVAAQTVGLTDYPSAAIAVANRETWVVANLDDPRLSDAERAALLGRGLRSCMAVPLAVDGRVMGVISVFDTVPRDFAEFEVCMRGVAAIIAHALENLLLVERLRETTQDLRQLVDAGLEFGASLDLDEVLHSIADRMCDVAGTSACTLFRLEEEKARALLSIESGVVDETRDGVVEALNSRGLWREAIEDRRSVQVEDVLGAHEATLLDKQTAFRRGYRGVIVLPLVVRGKVIGFAELTSANRLRVQRVDLLQGLAHIAGQAIANASLFANLDSGARRLELVAAQSLRLSATLELDAVVAATAQSMRESGGFADCDVFMVDRGEIQCVASYYNGAEDSEWAGRRLPLDDWPTIRQAVETGMTVLISSLDDPRIGPRELAVRQEFDERSVLIVPLLAKDRVIAVVELIDRRRAREYDNEQIATVEALSRVAGLALDNAGLYQDIKTMHLSNLKALSSALNAKDYYTLGHAARVAAYMVLLGKELGWPAEFVQHVEEVAYLHDIGKIGVSDRVLLKPGGLNAHEWELMRQHPMFSADIIRPLFDETLVEGVRHHHERFDGSGYPDGLTGAGIPLIARAMCVVDSYDAMSFRRPYRQALSYAECIRELRRCSGTQFDPEIVEAFVEVLSRVRVRKQQAVAVARQAAACIDPVAHAVLTDRAAESTPEYLSMVAALREVRDANPPTKFLGTRARLDGSFAIVVDVADEPELLSHIGDEVFADDELPEAFAGVTLDTVVLYVDGFGVWVSGLAPVRASDGTVVAVAVADMPPPGTDGGEMEGLCSDVTQSFSSMLRTAAAKMGRAEIEAITDGLSGLYNHRYLHERLEEELERAHHDGTQLSLLLCDIDRFKLYNELHGHSAGDDALRVVARVIEASIRHVDLAARYGGGEFAVILVETDARGAMEVGQRVRAGVNDAWAGTQLGPFSVSVGVATFPQDAATKAELLDKADWAMYLAKRQGRDRVLGFTGPEDGGSRP